MPTNIIRNGLFCLSAPWWNFVWYILENYTKAFCIWCIWLTLAQNWPKTAISWWHSPFKRSPSDLTVQAQDSSVRAPRETFAPAVHWSAISGFRWACSHRFGRWKYGSECVARGITRGRVSRDQNRVWYGMVYFEDSGTSSENGRIKVGCYDSKTGWPMYYLLEKDFH